MMNTLSIIPDDVIKEILSRSPAKSIIRFGSVSKAWHKLISDPFFTNLHLTRSLDRGPMHILLIFSTYREAVYLLDAENPSNVAQACRDYPLPYGRFNYALGSCHGLVCTYFDSDQKCVYAWNASTRQTMAFPHNGKLRADTSYGFFYDPACCVYKLLRVKKCIVFHSSKVSLYSIDDGEEELFWEVPYQIVPGRPGLVVNGAVHWIALSISMKYVILALNPACEEYDEIPMPDTIGDGDPSDRNLALLCGLLSIAFAYKNKFEVWLMNEYGVKKSWTKYCVVPTVGQNFRHLKFPLRVVPLHITKKGDLILQINYEKLFVYDQNQKSLRSIEIKIPEPGPYLLGNVVFITLVDSLVDIRQKNTEEPISSFQHLKCETVSHESRQCNSTVSEASPGNSLFENTRDIVSSDASHQSLENLSLSSNPPEDSFCELNSSEDPIFVPSEEIHAPSLSMQLRSMTIDNMYPPFENHQLPVLSNGLYTRAIQPHEPYNCLQQDRQQYETKHYENHNPSQMGIGYRNPRLFPIGFFQDPTVQNLIVDTIATMHLPMPNVSVQQYGTQGHPFQDPGIQTLIREALANIQEPMPTHSGQPPMPPVSAQPPMPPVSAQHYRTQGFINHTLFLDPQIQILIRGALANIQEPMPTTLEQQQYNLHRRSTP